jgi:hypothetical protein
MMKLLFPAGMLRLQFCQLGLCAFALLAIGACSKSDVNVAEETPAAAATPTAADRVVEIDRLLAVPLTGSPQEADRRSALRAEREALVASGQVPYRVPAQTVANRNAPLPANNSVTQRSANGNVMNYAAQTTSTGPITVATDSQAKNLSALEQMTPTEREHYYKTLKLQNTRRVEIDVRHR